MLHFAGLEKPMNVLLRMDGNPMHRLRGRASALGRAAIAPGLELKGLLQLLVLAAACVAAPPPGHAAGGPQHDSARVGSSVFRAYALRGAAPGGQTATQAQRSFTLPPPMYNGSHSLAELLKQRRSVRSFTATPLNLAQIGQLLWAAQGITAGGKLRTAPSAGALYPLELYVVAGHVEGLPAGVYHYDAHAHRLVLVESGDRRRAIASAAVQQMWVAEAPAIIVFGAVRTRTSAKYGRRADRFVHIETGHAAENLFLQAEDLDLGTTVVGSFDDDAVTRTLQFTDGVAPLLLMPVGVPR